MSVSVKKVATKMRRTVIAALVAAMVAPAQAAEPDMQTLLHEIKQLSERMATLEQDNTQLRKRLEAQPAATALAERVKALEDNNAKLEASMAEDYISENEPELTTRLKAVESQALGMQKSARVVEALEGVRAGASFTSVWQKPFGLDDDKSKINYRADVGVIIPAGEIGNATSTIFGHFRIGQGAGVANQMTAFSGPNASAFQLGSALKPDTSAVMLAEAYYQVDIPLPLGGFKPQSRQTLTIDFGKMDPFVFFDQNTSSNDEGRQFLSSMFVHNALLDNPLAANVGADGYGFSPGVRVAWRNVANKPENYQLSLGVFGSGPGAAFDGSFTSPFVIAQAEIATRYFGEQGHYRAMLWSNGQAPTYIADELRSHHGFGLNFDQRVGDYTTVFGRYGKAWGSHLPFDQTASLGLEFGGSDWSRAADAIGVAAGINRISRDFRNDALTLDADGDGNAYYGVKARGSEKMVEAYYRYRFNKQFELTPDIQWINDPAGNTMASSVTILGLRAQIVY
jgi:high affinity Mn2+ porin